MPASPQENQGLAEADCPARSAPASPNAANDHSAASSSPASFSPGTGSLRIAVFFCLIGALIFATDWIINRGFHRINTSDFGVTNRIVAGQINADILISGSSRALVHYDPRIIQSVTGRSAFNIGRNGSQTDMQVAVLKTYLQSNRKPSLVVHNLDLFSFVTTKEIYDPAQYIPYLDQQPIYEAVRNVYPGAWKWKYLPLYAYLVEDLRFTWVSGLKGFFGFHPPEDHYDGFVPRHLQWTEDFQKFSRHNQAGVTFAIEPKGLNDLAGIAEICHTHGVPLLFVYSPEYFEVQAIELNRREIFAEFSRLGEKYGVPIWDYSGAPISRERQYFYNSQHLNAGGADIFTRDFARRLLDHLGRRPPFPP